jgi:AraC family transcriptional regulator, transcriptional activator of pobA
MVADRKLKWERADSFVDRQINPEKFHVWPFGNSYPVDVRFLILDRRHDVPLHRPDHLEVVVFESGEMGYEVENSTCTVAKKDIIVVGDRLRHRCLRLRASQAEVRLVVLSFLPQTVHCGAPLGDDIQYLMPFSLKGPSVPNVIPGKTGLSREILDLVERIRPELPGASERSRLAIRTYLKMILLALVNYCSEIGEAREVFDRQREAVGRLTPIFEHLQQHYDEPIRVNHAARLCAASSCCFMNLFKEVTGQSFVGYLNRYRVAKAQSLLAATNKAISEISLETGFCNQSYFGVVFRRVTGMTPLAYRLQNEGSALPGSLQTAVSPPSTVKMPPTQ